MNRCNRTGLTDQDFKTILDVINVYDPNDIMHVYPEMGTPQFMQQVQSAFAAVLAHVKRQTAHVKRDHENSRETNHNLQLASQQFLHDS